MDLALDNGWYAIKPKQARNNLITRCILDKSRKIYDCMTLILKMEEPELP